MIVLSLFDGMSCGRIALEKEGIPVEKYYACELDDDPKGGKYAAIVSKANYPDNVRLGSITEWRDWDIDWAGINLVIGGSPCQGFSAAGKQGGTKAILNGEEIIVTSREIYLDAKEKGAEFLSQSYLFWEFVLCLDHVKAHNPNVKFMLENVKMAKNNMDMITDALGVEPMFINSALVSAQMRQRYYWFNWNVDLPKDRGISYQSILESGEARIEKAFSLTATYYKGGGEHTRQRNFTKSQRPIVWLSDTETRHCTLTECERLQTIPENYTAHVSNTQRYKMLGNGFTVDVIAHIFSNLK